MVTAFLLRLAEISHWFSLLAVVSGFLVTLVVLFRFFREDLASGGVTRVTSGPTPRMAVRRAPLPVAVALSEADGDGVRVRLTSLPPWRVGRVRVRLFAGVSVSALHHVLRGPWEWFLDAFEREGNPFGRDGCRQAGLLSEVEVPEGEEGASVRLRRPPGGDLDLGETPRRFYPFVVACVPVASELHSEENEGNVGAVLSVVHVKDERCPVPTQVLFTHLKHLDGGRSTTLAPIFVSGAAAGEDSSSSGEEKEESCYHHQSPGKTRCVVCQDLPVTRVTFPCRHACVCRRCFGRLRSRCPMCRTYIQSYFLLESEPGSGEEEDGEEGSAASASGGGRRTTNRTWGQWLEELNRNFALRMGLQENF